MATFVRNRVIHQLSWVDEAEQQRDDRREALCELDGLLTQLEEINLKRALASHGEIPVSLRIQASLRRHGIAVRSNPDPSELIEAIFLTQERYMRQPNEIPTALELALRRRMAS